MTKTNTQKNFENEAGNDSCCKQSSSLGSIIFFIILSTIAVIASLYYIVPQEVNKVIMNVEYTKVGGKENYDIINKMQLEQIKNYVQQYKQQGDKPAAANKDNAPQPTADAIKTLSKDELAAIKKGAYIEGNPEAKITIVEYSDLECPFCIRQFKEGNVEKTIEKYAGKVNNIFKNFRGVPHENSEAEANAALCAGDLGGLKAYSFYYKQIFSRSNGGNGTGFSKDNLVPLAKEAGLDGAKFQACLDSKKNIEKFDADTAEGKKLGVQGTPGNVIINNETGKYMLIAGAYPASEFEAKIEELLK
ncbi:MAG: thioredoxin domain-containing protein [Candidatus Gracilibacteria bacterium]|nr:thioredoxin domain-containing protein [Candidatus Gracilibacteria bacterium]